MNNLTKEDLITFETKIANHFDEGKLPFLVHLSGGNEEQLINIFSEILEGDYVFSTHRCHYHALLHGMEPDVVEQRILDGRSMFLYDRERNFFTSAIMGGTVAIAAGVAMALKRKGSDQKVWCFIGDGNSDSGHLVEAARYVDGYELPCTFIVENNNRSVEASIIDRWGTVSSMNLKCVRGYDYEIPWPHARTGNMADMSKTVRRTDLEIFPMPEVERVESAGKYVINNDSTYGEAITQAMTILGQEGIIFVGYNVRYGDAMGTLKNVPDELKIETPVAENLMSGLGMGLSLEGYKTVIYYERHDFMLVAMDAIGNHMDKLNRISHGEYNYPIILRAVVAEGSPFYSGPTHEQDLTSVFRELVDFPILDPKTPEEMFDAYMRAKEMTGPVMIVERKKLWATK